MTLTNITQNTISQNLKWLHFRNSGQMTITCSQRSTLVSGFLKLLWPWMLCCLVGGVHCKGFSMQGLVTFNAEYSSYKCPGTLCGKSCFYLLSDILRSKKLLIHTDSTITVYYFSGQGSIGSRRLCLEAETAWEIAMSFRAFPRAIHIAGTEYRSRQPEQHLNQLLMASPATPLFKKKKNPTPFL